MWAIQGGTAEQEADRRLLEYSCYEDYLDRLVDSDDHRFMRSVDLVRKIAELGFRSTGETLSREGFTRRYKKALELVTVRKQYSPCISPELYLSFDPLVQQLAVRERANRSGILSTIIYIRLLDDKGCELSAFIDYANRLETTDLTGVFTGRASLLPSRADLSYFNWKNQTVTTTDTPNFKCVIEPHGIVFVHKWDYLKVDPNPALDTPGPNSRKLEVVSANYKQAMILDHVIRTKG